MNIAMNINVYVQLFLLRYHKCRCVDALNVIVIVQMYLIAQESDYVSSEQRPSGI